LGQRSIRATGRIVSRQETGRENKKTKKSLFSCKWNTLHAWREGLMTSPPWVTVATPPPSAVEVMTAYDVSLLFIYYDWHQCLPVGRRLYVRHTWNHWELEFCGLLWSMIDFQDILNGSYLEGGTRERLTGTGKGKGPCKGSPSAWPCDGCMAHHALLR
jgi:hypothetical protein